MKNNTCNNNEVISFRTSRWWRSYLRYTYTLGSKKINPSAVNVRRNAGVTCFHVTLTSNVTIVRNVKKKCIYKLQFDTNFEISQIVVKLREIVIKISSKNDEVDEKNR